MSYPQVDFLYLKESDMVKAGVTDMHHCVEVMNDVFALLSKGDYVMGGKNHNSHGIKISFPKVSEFPNMPLAGPDRRFMAMITYLGGKFNVCGEKWYGSNVENKLHQLPRSILMIMLNDAETGAPLALQSGNLVSAFRTGAIPGVGAKYLARKDSKVCALIGAGAISRTCFMSLIDVCKNLDTVKICDVYPAASEKLSSFIKATYPQIKKVELCSDMESAIREADIVNVATSGAVIPAIEESWLKPGAYVSLPAGIDMDPDFVLHRARRIIDNWKMYEAWADEVERPFHDNLDLIGGLYLDWIADGKMTKDMITDLGDVITGKAKGRESEDEIVLFGMGGQPVYDVAWGYTVYKKALEMGLGTKLNLWDKPYLY